MSTSAAQIPIVRRQIDKWLAKQTALGRMFEGELRYFYAGDKGHLSEEIDEDTFAGGSGDLQPGYYVVLATDTEGTQVLLSPWVAVHRERGAQIGRDRTVEGGYGDLLDEYRATLAEKNRANAADISRRKELEKELDRQLGANTELREELVRTRVERDGAVLAAADMEHERDQAIARVEALQEEVDSFAPHIEMFVDQTLERVGPGLERLLGMSLEGEAAGEVSATANSAPSNSAAREAAAAPVSPGEDPGPLGGQETAEALYHSLWMTEQVGRFLTGEIIPEFRMPWAAIRGLVWNVRGIDLGPVPAWPSDVAKAARDETDATSADSADKKEQT